MKPYAIAIHDKRRGTDGLSFDLVDVLRVDDELTRSLRWKCLCALCTGASGDKLYDLSDKDQPWISGERLLYLASGVEKTIDCLFEGYREGEDGFHLVIEGWSDDCFIVITRNRDFVKKVRAHFHTVRVTPRYRDYPEHPYKDKIIKLLEQRLAKSRSAKVKWIPADQVLKELRRKFAKRKSTKTTSARRHIEGKVQPRRLKP